VTGGSTEVPGGPLAGLRVVALEHSVAGPLCSRILADLGADVVKVERPPAGDFARHWDANAAGEGAQFWWLNRGKRDIALDLRSVADRDVLERLLAGADVLVENLSPQAARRLGLAAADVERRHPRLIHCQITGYGAGGAYQHRKAYDMLVQAEAGVMGITGTEDQPARAGMSVSDVSTGIYAALLVLAAVQERARSGRGRHLDVAMFDVTTEFLAPMLVSYLNAGVRYPRLPDRHHAIAPYGVFHCADGRPVLLAIQQDAEWALLCRHVLGRDDLAADERFRDNAARLANRDEVDGLVGRAIGALGFDEAVALLERCGFAYAALNEVADVAAHPVLVERGIV
jgi:itaconate CoA-transferase